MKKRAASSLAALALLLLHPGCDDGPPPSCIDRGASSITLDRVEDGTAELLMTLDLTESAEVVRVQIDADVVGAGEGSWRADPGPTERSGRPVSEVVIDAAANTLSFEVRGAAGSTLFVEVPFLAEPDLTVTLQASVDCGDEPLDFDTYSFSSPPADAGTPGDGGTDAGTAGDAGTDAGASDAGSMMIPCGASTCSGGEFCDYLQDTCFELPSSPGQCVESFPCPGVGEPACGCDGTIYDSACEANRAGIDVSTTGACTPPSGTFRCGFVFCDQAVEYCQALENLDGTSFFECLPISFAGCGATAECPCIDDDCPLAYDLVTCNADGTDVTLVCGER